MFLSCVRTGMVDIAAVLRRILLVLLVGLTACFAAAIMATPGTAAHPIAATFGLATAPSVSACASPSPSNKSWASALSASKLSDMQIKIFTIPIAGDDAILKEMNLFLRAHKIVDVRKEMANVDGCASWTF